jgi:hypothetical protein
LPGFKINDARELQARYRAIRQLASLGQDHENEAKALEGEVRSKRGAIDKWHGSAFWFGILYDLFSDFGRSMIRPFTAWSIGVLAFAAFYLSQTDVMLRNLELQEVSYLFATAETGRHALGHSVPCYASSENTSDQGLSETLRSQTNARAEALNSAFRNALVAIDGGSDSSYRIYGCLYGLADKTPIVPSVVSTASAIQKLISGVLIFLFGLALRNMLTVK